MDTDHRRVEAAQKEVSRHRQKAEVAKAGFVSILAQSIRFWLYPATFSDQFLLQTEPCVRNCSVETPMVVPTVRELRNPASRLPNLKRCSGKGRACVRQMCVPIYKNKKVRKHKVQVHDVFQIIVIERTTAKPEIFLVGGHI